MLAVGTHWSSLWNPSVLAESLKTMFSTVIPSLKAWVTVIPLLKAQGHWKKSLTLNNFLEKILIMINSIYFLMLLGFKEWFT